MDDTPSDDFTPMVPPEKMATRASGVIRSSLTMILATTFGLSWGVAVDHSILPLVAFWFPLVGVASIFVLFLALLSALYWAYRESPSKDLPLPGMVGLTLFAVLCFFHTSPEDGIVFTLLSLPFIVGAGHFARHRLWLATIGTMGFSAALIALAYCNPLPQVTFLALRSH